MGPYTCMGVTTEPLTVLNDAWMLAARQLHSREAETVQKQNWHLLKLLLLSVSNTRFMERSEPFGKF